MVSLDLAVHEVHALPVRVKGAGGGLDAGRVLEPDLVLLARDFVHLFALPLLSVYILCSGRRTEKKRSRNQSLSSLIDRNEILTNLLCQDWKCLRNTLTSGSYLKIS